MNYEQFIRTIDTLLETAIINEPSSQTLKELNESTNDSSCRNLPFIKRLNVQAKASLRKDKTAQAFNKLRSLIEVFGKKEYLKKLLQEPKYQNFNISLFSKFEQLSETDKESMLLDQTLLELMDDLEKNIENE